MTKKRKGGETREERGRLEGERNSKCNWSSQNVSRCKGFREEMCLPQDRIRRFKKIDECSKV
jgi:hypothetical protein